jgi:hypothetical protein
VERRAYEREGSVEEEGDRTHELNFDFAPGAQGRRGVRGFGLCMGQNPALDCRSSGLAFSRR